MYMKENVNFNIYYLRNEKNFPFATIAVAPGKNGTVYRGVSICSPEDQFKKSVGRSIAIKRLNAAIQNNSNGDVLCYMGSNNSIINDMMNYLEDEKHNDVKFDLVSLICANQQPSKFEQNLVKDLEQNLA